MTNEERQIITDFVARVGGVAAPTPGQWSGATVPATATPALPPVDREADAFIADQFSRYPEARYRITQLAFVQEHALVEAQNRIKRLEWELQQSQQAAQQNPQQQHGGGFFSGLFGGGRSPNQPPPGAPQGGPWGQNAPPPGYQGGYAPPPPQYPPGYNPGVFQRQGSGFLGSALTTAAGVAGGVLAADALRDMFSSHQGMGVGGGLAPGMASSWGAPTPSDPAYVDQGSWTPDPGAGAAPPDQAPDQGYVDQGTWDQGGTDQGAWNDPSGGADQSGWNDPSGGMDQGGGLDDQSGGGSDDDSLI